MLRQALNSALLLGAVSADQCCYHTCGSAGCNPEGSYCSQSQSNCEGNCHGSFCPSGPAPPPPPPPGPPAPTKTYCPDPAKDFQEEIEAGAQGSVEWSDNGWTVHGQRRVSSKASYNMKGGSVEWDMDLAGAHGNVNTNFYVTFPRKPNCGINCYCDSGATGGCAELDFTENNGNCWHATTWHPDPNGGDKSGEAQEGGIGPQTHFKAEWSADGGHLDVHVGGSTYGGQGLADIMTQYGAVIYSSQWQGWVPGGNRCGNGDLGSSTFTVKNIRIKGSVVQGPEPRECSSAELIAANSSAVVV